MKTTKPAKALPNAPLADRIRPVEWDYFLGQENLTGPDSPLKKAIDADTVPSLILWGPPGSGKTTLARIIAHKTRARFVAFSAVTSSIRDLRAVMEQARHDLTNFQQKTIVFVDEIHRFNKGQQDAFLPHVENGTIVLIGATTENPSFSVISALLSRTQVYVLKALSPADIEAIVVRALAVADGLGSLGMTLEPAARRLLAQHANGDARRALNLLEITAQLIAADKRSSTATITADLLSRAAAHKSLLYDTAGEEHYNLISALHKSLRGSDENASLYYLARMIEAGEDPLYVARRLVRFASEDVGLADNNKGLLIANAALTACREIGLPECNLALAQAVVYLARAPKDKTLYLAYGLVQDDIKKYGNLDVPLHIRNAPTRLMKDLGYGHDYQYYQGKKEGVSYLPEQIKNQDYIAAARRKQDKRK